jgi:hypothetical protein
MNPNIVITFFTTLLRIYIHRFPILHDPVEFCLFSSCYHEPASKAISHRKYLVTGIKVTADLDSYFISTLLSSSITWSSKMSMTSAEDLEYEGSLYVGQVFTSITYGKS